MAIQYTVRNVPKEVDRALRKRAKERKVSLNHVILEALAEEDAKPRKYRDVSDLCGSWDPTPEWEDFMADMRRIDWEKWQ
ncbi:MAG: hypothetical protein SFV18_04280 [Bryobacteraceae bacterium]|nr:hypothetical protein [Bryobacteraceae bacterium]